jgi:hypothetical protein
MEIEDIKDKKKLRNLFYKRLRTELLSYFGNVITTKRMLTRIENDKLGLLNDDLETTKQLQRLNILNNGKALLKLTLVMDSILDTVLHNIEYVKLKDKELKLIQVELNLFAQFIIMIFDTGMHKELFADVDLISNVIRKIDIINLKLNLNQDISELITPLMMLEYIRNNG